MAITINPEDYLTPEQLGFTPEAQEDARFAEVGRNLAARKEYTAADSFNEMTGAPSLDLEVQLQQVQAQLHRETNALKQHQLAQQAEELATQIVNARAEAEGQELTEQEVDDSVEQLLSVYGRETVDNTLQWASTGISEELRDEANEVLSKGGDESIQTFNALKDLSELPQEAIGRGGEEIAFDITVANELSETYGEAGDNIAAINAALVAGECTRAQAARMVMSDPRMLHAAMDAARRGLIRLAL